MFKHILVPTDGSKLSENAARSAVELARSTGGRITAFHVAPAYHLAVREEQVADDFMLPDDYETKVRGDAARHLNAVRDIATEMGVDCDGEYALSDFPAEAIVSAVQRYGCDSIVMGTHGRTGLNRLLFGSETQKVLTATKVAVVVTH